MENITIIRANKTTRAKITKLVSEKLYIPRRPVMTFYAEKEDWLLVVGCSTPEFKECLPAALESKLTYIQTSDND